MGTLYWKRNDNLSPALLLQDQSRVDGFQVYTTYNILKRDTEKALNSEQNKERQLLLIVPAGMILSIPALLGLLSRTGTSIVGDLFTTEKMLGKR